LCAGEKVEGEEKKGGGCDPRLAIGAEEEEGKDSAEEGGDSGEEEEDKVLESAEEE
jgi:hypothetical protein